MSDWENYERNRLKAMEIRLCEEEKYLNEMDWVPNEVNEKRTMQ